MLRHTAPIATALGALTALAALAALTLFAGPALAGVGDGADGRPAQAEARFLELINASRAEAGAGPLVVNDALAGIARTWSGQMAAVADLSHNPSYAEQYSGEWHRMAENVGVMFWPAGTVEQMVSGMHQRFLDSSGHRRNLLNPAYNQVGVGVVIIADTLWVTVNFLDGPLPAGATLHDTGTTPPLVLPYHARR